MEHAKDSKIILSTKTKYLEIVYYIFYVINYIIKYYKYYIFIVYFNNIHRNVTIISICIHLRRTRELWYKSAQDNKNKIASDYSINRNKIKLLFLINPLINSD